MLNKRGDVNWVLISLVLGVIVLVVLALGLTGAWKTFLPWLNIDNNVNTIVNQCQVSCTTGDVYGYCNMNKTLRSTDLPNKQAIGTCNFFSTDVSYSPYGIAPCAQLCPEPAPTQ
jgi:hypothetical protein